MLNPTMVITTTVTRTNITATVITQPYQTVKEKAMINV